MVTRTLCLLFLLALSASAQTPRIPPPESVNRNGLVGRWIVPGSQTGNGLAPTASHDASGNGNHGVAVNSPIVTVNSQRLALRTNGSSSFHNVGNPVNLSFNPGTQSFTLMSWFQKNTDKNNNVILTKQGSVGNINYGLGDAVAETYAFVGINGVVSYSASLLPSVSTGSWHHIAGVYDVRELKMSLYVNGVFKARSPQWGSGTNAISNRDLYIGSDQANIAVRTLNGFLSDVRIYNRALTADEIKRIYRGVQ